jgi:hypothetical protein
VSSLGGSGRAVRTPVTRYLWALTLLTVPFTSLPWLPLGATVSPLSLVFMLPTLVLGLASARRLRCLVGSPMWLLSIFAVWAVAVTIWHTGDAHALAGPRSVFEAGLHEIITLSIGVGFYATAILMITNRRELAFASRWLMLGLGASVAVALVQGVALLLAPSLYDHINEFFATYIAIDMGARAGARGFTLEPSWLASQLTVLGLPIILARSFDPESLRRWRIRAKGWSFRVQPNWLVLALFVAALALSLSRGGLLTSVAMLLVACPFLLVKARSIKDLLVPVLFLSAVALMVAVAYLASPYVRTVFDFPDNRQSVFEYLRTTGAINRVTLWITWWRTFLDSPITGVGLGQSTFYFYSNVPFWTVREWEIFQYVIGVLPDLPNSKNMFIRLLAETGIVGAVLFLAFVVRHFVYALSSRGTQSIVFATGLAIALTVDFMSLDTFALPTLWFALALLWNMSRFEREQGLRSAEAKHGPWAENPHAWSGQARYEDHARRSLEA